MLPLMKAKKGRWLDSIAQLQQDHPELFPAGTAPLVHVAHDDDCPMLNGGVECTCEAEIRVVPDFFEPGVTND